jgi:hypothetical protein
VNIGGGVRFDEEGNAIPRKLIGMVVEGENICIVSVRVHGRQFVVLTFFSFAKAEDGELIILDASSADGWERKRVDTIVPPAGRHGGWQRDERGACGGRL